MKRGIAVFVLSFLLGILVRPAKKAWADEQSSFDGWNYTEVGVSSAQIFNGFGRVKAIYASTDTEAGGNYMVLFDTPGGCLSSNITGASCGNSVNTAFPASYTDAERRSPPIMFIASGTFSPTNNIVSNGSNMWKVLDYGE